MKKLLEFRLIAAAPLVVWTLFIWGTRLRNAFDDETLAGSERVQAFGTAGVFVVLAVAVAMLLWLCRRRAVGPIEWVVIGGTAVFSIVFWLVRMVTIAFGDHSLGFVVVHAVLGLGSVTASVLALRSLRRWAASAGNGGAGQADQEYTRPDFPVGRTS